MLLRDEDGKEEDVGDEVEGNEMSVSCHQSSSVIRSSGIPEDVNHGLRAGGVSGVWVRGGEEVVKVKVEMLGRWLGVAQVHKGTYQEELESVWYVGGTSTDP